MAKNNHMITSKKNHPCLAHIKVFSLGLCLTTLSIGCDGTEEYSSDIPDEFELDEFELEDELASMVVESMPTPEDRAIVEPHLTITTDPSGYQWTNFWFSEETLPSFCPAQQLVTGVDCDGWYCDNLMLECNPTSRALGGVSVTTWFSEESESYYRTCPDDKYVIGMECSGGWCDNLRLYCTSTGYTPLGSECVWSNPFSEEQNAFLAPVGYAIKGVACYGAYCDNKRYQYCRI
jgi:hypothetical protein